MEATKIITSLRPDDFSLICRICLNAEDLRVIPETLIENIEASVLLENIVEVVFDKTDLMPTNVCDKCLMTLFEAYKLKRQCFINERLFHIQINKHENMIGPELMPSSVIKTEEETIAEQATDRVTSSEQHKAVNIKLEPNDDELPAKNAGINKPMGMQNDKSTEPDTKASTDPILNSICMQRNQLNIRWVAPSPITPMPAIARSHTKTLHLEDSEDVKPLTQSINQAVEAAVKKRKRNIKIPCGVCKKLIGHRWMKFHLMSHDENRPKYPCDECPETLKDEYRLKLHKLKHVRERGYKCANPNCEKIFRVPSSLIYHMKVCRADKPNDPEEFLCKVCGQIFLRRHTLRKHLMEHVTRKEAAEEDIAEVLKDCPYTCDICSRLYETELHLKIHMTQIHTETPCLCNICGKNFSSKEALLKHMRIHKGEKPYACDICHKAFTSRYEVTSHMYSHTDERPFPCQICEKKFKSSASLNKHVFLHNGKKPYKCKYCDKSFAEPGNLRKHTATHTGEKRYFCSICNKGFYERNMARSHEAKHKLTIDSETNSDKGD